MSLKLPIYFDHSATTPVDRRVLDAMLPYFAEDFGNPASRNHPFGWKAEEAIDNARDQIAALIGAQPKEIVFTSGATESDNLALFGTAYFLKEKGNHIITVNTEHKAILDSCLKLSREGFEITYLGVNSEGLIDLEELKAAITDKTILVSVMFVNNEIGVIQDLKSIGAICRERGVFFHTDAVQGVGKLPFNVDEMNVDMASITGHKMYGPKGIGALYVRSRKPRVRLSPLLYGGGHEKGMRSGTLNTPGIVGLGKACEIYNGPEQAEEATRLLALRQRLWDGLNSQLDHIYLNGSWEQRLPGNLNVSFEFVEGESILMAMKDIAVSSGSACTSASLEPSHVMKALGLGDELAHSSIRFTLGRHNTEEEVDYTIDIVVAAIKRLRELSPIYEMFQEGIDLSSIQWAEAAHH
jgi:cysteine desulfurase